MRAKIRVAALAAGALCVALSASACAGAGGGNSAGDPNAINVLMVNNPQMVDLQKLTADNFTKKTGITVNYTVLPENDAAGQGQPRSSRSQAGQYDVATAVELRDPDLRRQRLAAPAG